MTDDTGAITYARNYDPYGVVVVAARHVYQAPAYHEYSAIIWLTMPTVWEHGPYRFFFYSGDRDEPPHVHVEHEKKIAKFWLDPVRLQSSGRYNRSEINRIQRLIEENQKMLLEKWDDYFSN